MNVSGRDGPTNPSRSLPFTRVTDDANLVESLRRVATSGCRLLDHCTAASVTLIASGRPVTMAASDDVAMEMDRAQYDVGDGPCLTAARQERFVRIDTLSDDGRWPVFQRAGLHHGIASSLSVPLLIEDPDMFGGLNIYADTPSGFTEADERLAESFAAEAAVVVANVVAYWSAFDLTRNLTAAMEHRGVIEQAKGILMGANRCSADEAFDLLRRRSQTENRKLRDVAIDVVASIQRNGDE